MQVFETVAELRAALSWAPRPIGLVPTMGYLHQGHTSLIERARAECSTVVVSIFVNPAQFGPHEDLDRYPRDLPRDLALCGAAGADIVFTPTVAEIYPPGDATIVEVHGLQDRWEGASRPGHFRGVATVVAKLFRIAQPSRAYFGEKDYQQLQIVKRLAADLRLDVEVIGCPTIREADGLACSSRNVSLSPEDRAKATVLSQALAAALNALDAGERTGEKLAAKMREVIAGAPGAVLDYAAVVDAATLEPLERVERHSRALIAVHLGGVHLIDNAPLVPPPSQ